jgi:4-amino-4-deoxy-L-arabinose transferase-like glycosyltransferase
MPAGPAPADRRARAAARLSEPWSAKAVAAVTCLLAAALWVLDVGHGTDRGDEAWLLQVVSRVGSGDHLYRDVFFGVPPLSVWLGVAATKVFGLDVGVLKALSALIEAATIVVAVAVARRLRVGLAGQALVGLAALVYVQLPSISIYLPLSYLLALLSLLAVVVWQERAAVDRRSARQMLLLAGAAAGLAAASKHTVGAYACVALAVSVIAAPPRPGSDLRERLLDAGLALSVAVGAFAVTMVPVIAGGDLDAFVTYAIDKGPYVTRGTVSYLDGFDQLADMAALPSLGGVLRRLAVVGPPLALLALAFAAATGWRRELTPVAAFTLAAVAGIFPRADLPHVLPAVPICAIAIAAVLRPVSARAPARRVRSAAALAGLVLAATGGWTLLITPVRALQAGERLSTTPHFHWALASPSRDRAAADVASALSRPGPTLVLSAFAGYDYLAAGARNPTRFDYPLSTTFRDGDERRLVERIERGDFAAACVGYLDVGGDRRLRPERLVAAVTTRMSRAGRVGSRTGDHDSCVLYTRR